MSLDRKLTIRANDDLSLRELHVPGRIKITLRPAEGFLNGWVVIHRGPNKEATVIPFKTYFEARIWFDHSVTTELALF